MGVRTRDGAELHADVVVLAGGRSLPLARWLGEIGAAVPEERTEDCGLIYYCRYLRTLPIAEDAVGTPPLAPIIDLNYLAAAVLPGDNDTFYALLAPGSWDSAVARAS